MKKRILIVDGHPDAARVRFVHALADEYARVAEASGHTVRVVKLAELEFPWLHSAGEFAGTPPPAIVEQQERLRWADHLVIVYPLWLGSMPALLKAFFEQVMRPGFAFAYGKGRGLPRKLLAGKSARIVVTMGMPSLFYRLYYRAHTVRSLARNILGFVGFKPVRISLIGSVEGMSANKRARCIAEIASHARRGV
ncbi:MAG TPA: NAD(P)H-dependent oxidoreductase [Steroidobacteraceae bacterium]